ncbi:glycosyltransferase family 2 protein [Mucilaginibacter auburnensis]|uniref:Glycosyl transferase family 2 n=1 Tax=Mucilaginibacter auburnensis TaxID=1457233 RepID=A0A2H9VTE0_9SPHI|nr:glycosyltransferase [Mucilaginibacter auburnensis]PJJ84052.1 glycosyl transferase family 2 [Mucilaginibacter auburnensis]
MGNNPKVSVIIPVYNAQRHLEKCVNSVINQSFDDLEVILINDGSADSSGQMCDEFAGRDKRIRVFHQSNKGISYTRQFAIDNATGDYIQFVDSDDWIEANTLAELYGYAAKNDLDVIGSNFVMDLGSKNKNIICQYPTPDKFREAVISNEWGVVWKHFMRRNLFSENGISFPSGINHGEDYIVCVKLLLATNKIATLNLFGYHYNYIPTDTSLTRNSGIKSTLDQIYATSVVEEFIDSNPAFARYKAALTKRKLYCSQNLITDSSNIIFKHLRLKLASALKFVSLRSVPAFFVLMAAKLKMIADSFLKS